MVPGKYVVAGISTVYHNFLFGKGGLYSCFSQGQVDLRRKCRRPLTETLSPFYCGRKKAMLHSQLNPTNFVPTTCPRIVKTFQSTSKNCWYRDWIGEEYTVISSVDDSYLVHTWNGDGEMIPSLIFKNDCKTVVL